MKQAKKRRSMLKRLKMLKKKNLLLHCQLTSNCYEVFLLKAPWWYLPKNRLFVSIIFVCLQSVYSTLIVIYLLWVAFIIILVGQVQRLFG